jgi:hypothetical protein
MEKATQGIIVLLLTAIVALLAVSVFQRQEQIKLLQPSRECKQARSEMLSLILDSNERIGQIKGILTQMPALTRENQISMYQVAQLEILAQMAANNIKIYQIFSVCP